MAFLINTFQSFSGAYQTGKEVLHHASQARRPATLGAALGALYGIYTSKGNLAGRANYIMNCAAKGAFFMTAVYVFQSMHQAKMSKIETQLNELKEAMVEGLRDVKTDVREVGTKLDTTNEVLTAQGGDIKKGAEAVGAMVPVVRGTFNKLVEVQEGQGRLEKGQISLFQAVGEVAGFVEEGHKETRQLLLDIPAQTAQLTARNLLGDMLQMAAQQRRKGLLSSAASRPELTQP